MRRLLPRILIYDRRKFLLSSSAVSLAAILEQNGYGQVAATGQEKEEDDPVNGSLWPDTGRKFNPDGTPRPFAGNTVICHLPQQSKVRDAIGALSSSLRASSFARKLAILPADSYHMTIFAGANDQDRAVNRWPADVPIDTPIPDCNRILGERIANFRMRAPLPLRVCVNPHNTLGSLSLSPVDAAENAKLRTLRDRLAAEVFRFRDSDHDAYRFHISLAYQLRHFTPAEAREHRTILGRHIPAIIAARPIMELGVPEFCTFGDMFRFEITTLLRT